MSAPTRDDVVSIASVPMNSLDSTREGAERPRHARSLPNSPGIFASNYLRMKSMGTAASWATTEKTTSPAMETS